MSDLCVSLAGNLGVAYPERSTPRAEWYETGVRELKALFSLPESLLLRRFDAIVERTGRHALAIGELSDEQLREQAAAVGRQMRVEGFALERVAQAFALVREAATRHLGQRHYDVQLIGG